MSEYTGWTNTGWTNPLDNYSPAASAVQPNQLQTYQTAANNPGPAYPPWMQPPVAGATPKWTASTWAAGMPATPHDVDMSHLPMPTADDIQAQRQLIYDRLKKYGYTYLPPMSDQEVLSTMAPLPQKAIEWPPWVQEYFKRHPEDMNSGSARLGVDVPFNTTYEEYNLRNRGLNPARPTQIGGMYAIPRGALVERYGQAAVDAEVDDWIRRGSTPGAILDIVHER